MKARKVASLTTLKSCKIIRPINGIWLSVGPIIDSPVVITIHRHQKRTVECFDSGCPFCSELWTAEERIFIPVGSRIKRAVLEVPVSHLERLKGWENQFHTLRAVTLDLRRSNGLPNGPIEWRCFPRSDGVREKIEGWDWLSELSETWRSNTQFALSAVAGEKTSSKFHPGCDVLGSSDH